MLGIEVTIGTEVTKKVGPFLKNLFYLHSVH